MREFDLRTELEPPFGNHRLQTLGVGVGASFCERRFEGQTPHFSETLPFVGSPAVLERAKRDEPEKSGLKTFQH